jgi:predicted RNA-binding protein with RPS1 domain
MSTEQPPVSASAESTTSASVPTTPPATGGAPGSGGSAAAKPAKPGKELPPVSKAQVVGSEGAAPPGGGPGRGPRGPRPDRRERGPVDLGERNPNTKATLQAVRDEGKATDADLQKEIDQMLADVAPELRVAEAPKPRIKPVEPARVRGPRRVEAAREIRPGRVVSVGPSDIFLEFGPKELGVIPRQQWKDDETPPAVAETIEVVVDKFDTTENLFHCSRPGTVQKAAWETLQVGQVIEARVSGVNKGGLELEVAGHRAFMPAGQVSLDRIEDLSVFIGEKFTCTVTKLDTRGAGNIVLSRKDLLKAEREEQGKKLRENLAEGQTVEGIVRKIMPFGAFVDLGGLDGLVHIGDLSYDRVFPGEKNVEKYVKVNDKVKVKILKLDIEANKISLGLKQLGDDPFVTAVSEIVEGAEISGRVVRLTEFGAFVEVAPGVDGLVHISEISRRRINKPEDVLTKDQIVQCKVLKVEPDGRKISLSIRALEKAPEADPNDPRIQKRLEREKQSAERLAEIQKETPQLRKAREQFKGKSLSGGFGEKAKFLGGGLGDLGKLLGQ